MMKYRLQDLIDMEHFQNLQDRLNEIYSFPSAIIDNEGNILTATAWQDICTQFHRKNKDSERICIKSDQYIKDHIHEANPAVSYRCPHGLVDNATPIIIEGIHYGNFFTGQFFLEVPDMDFFRTNAKKYGFDEDAYLEAVKRVPTWTQEQLNNYLYFIKGLIAVISESGLKKLKEMENRKSIEAIEKRHRSILKSAMDGYWLTDTEGRLLEVNDAYCIMSGYSENELLNMRIPDVEAVEDPKLVAEHMQKVILQGSDRFESKHRRKDGTVFDVEISIQFRPEDDGQCVCFLRDIVERKRAEKSLQASEKRYRTLFENMVQGVFYQGADGVLFDYNNAALEMLGLTQDQFIGKTSLDPQWKVIKEDGTDLPGDKHPSMIALETGEPVRDAIVGVYNPRSNNYKWLVVNAIPEFYKAGEKPYQVFVTLQDITDRRKIERQYQMLFNEMLDGFALHEIICDPAGQPVDYRFLAVNPAFEKMTGLKAAQILNRTVLDVFQGIERHWIETYGKVALTGEPAFFENYAADIGKHFQVTAFRPSPNQFACIFANITERKKAEDALKESELFLENMSDIAYRADNQGNLVWVNSAGERVTGLSRDDLIGKPFLPLFIEAHHPSLIDVYKRSLMGESLENTLTFKSGVTCHFTSLPRRNENGDIVGTFGVARDITAQLDAQIALQNSEARLKRAQETAKIGNWEYDITTGKVWGSEEAFRIYGIERTSEFLPLDIVESYIIDSKRVNQALVDLVTKGEKYDIEFQITRKNSQELITIHSMAELVKDEEGNPEKVLGVIQDITEKKAKEEEYIKLLSLLQQAQKMESIGTLAGGIAHDFNNILFPILGMSEMLLEDLPLGSPEHQSVREIFNAGRRASDLVKQILAFSRQTEHKMMPVNAQQVLKEVVKLTRSTIPSDIEVSHYLQSDCGLVIADPTQLHQIAMNLITNAFHAVEQTAGKISITLKETVLESDDLPDSSLEPGNYALMSVADTGFGIDPAVMDKIFEPYFTTKEQGKGTGLGLAVVYGIVKQHGGDVKVYSEIGKGSTFDVYLPLAVKHVEQASSNTVEVSQTGTERILLVDDEEAIVALEKQMLERLGYRVTTRLNSVEALEAFKANPDAYDLILSDMTMPNMTGDKLAQKLVAIRPNIPIIICTGFSERLNPGKAAAIGAKGFLMKPIVKSEMAKMVRNVLDKAKVAAQGKLS